MDGRESFLLWDGFRSVNADIAGSSSHAPSVILADLPAPGSTIIGPWAVVTAAFESLLSEGINNTRSLDDSPFPTGACVPGYGTCSGEPEVGRSGSKTETRHGCAGGMCDGPVREVVNIGGHPGVISTQMTLKVAFDGSKVSIDVTIEMYGEIHDAATGKMIFRIENTGTGHADGDACPDASGTTKLHFEFTAKENYFNGADPDGGRVGYGLNQRYTADVTVRVDDNANMIGIDVAAKAHEDSKGGVRKAGASQSDLFAHSVDASQTETFGYDPATGFAGGTTSDFTATSVDALKLSAWMYLYTTQPAKAGAKAAEKAWRSGMCIKVHAIPNGGTVDRESVTSIDVTVKQRYEDTELDKPVEAVSFSGVTSLDPVGKKQAAPATFVFTAGPKEGDRAGMRFESVSNRGIGHTAVTFEVGKSPASLTGTLTLRRTLIHDADFPDGYVTQTDTTVVQVRLRAAAQIGSNIQFGDDGSSLTYTEDYASPGSDPLCPYEDHGSASGTVGGNDGLINASYTTGAAGAPGSVQVEYSFAYAGTHMFNGCGDDEPYQGHVEQFGCNALELTSLPIESSGTGAIVDFSCTNGAYTHPVTGAVFRIEISGTLVFGPAQ